MSLVARMSYGGLISFTVTFWIIYSIAEAANISGVPRVVDGDTLVVGATKVRLEGIDAPETDQICLNAKGDHWTCGIEARDRLQAHIEGQAVFCLSNSTDVYQRSLAKCSLEGEDLNGWMIREGWAIAYLKYSSAYQQIEDDARVHQRGLWQGAFIAPWDWRHKNNKTVILGALQVPTNAQALLLGPSATEGAPSPNCTIKGNINRYGERIYHMQNQSFYAKIRMDKGGDRRWFCTPEEAEVAGWRRALR
jgi:endonuclease YncB( thermonuclease family)